MSRARLRFIAPVGVLLLVLAIALFGTPDRSAPPASSPLPAGPRLASAETTADPVLVIRSFKTTPSTLSVGGRFKLTMSLDNVVDEKASNIVVTLGTSTVATSGATATTAPQVVVLGSNTRFVGNMDGEETSKSVTFDMISNPQGGPGPFSLPVTIEFDAEAGGRGAVTQSLGLMLTRTLAFDVGALTYPRETTAGAAFNMSVTVQNTNEFPVNGVALKFMATGVSWTSSEATVGTLDPGKTAKLDAVGMTDQPGSLVVTMIISYKDDYNQTKEIRRDLTIAVAAKPVAAPEPVRPARPKTTGGLVALFIKAMLGLGG